MKMTPIAISQLLNPGREPTFVLVMRRRDGSAVEVEMTDHELFDYAAAQRAIVSAAGEPFVYGPSEHATWPEDDLLWALFVLGPAKTAEEAIRGGRRRTGKTGVNHG
jgi:hypothetical protein